MSLDKNYIQIAFESRGLQYKESETPQCERCKCAKSQDVDHIEGRGGKHNVLNRMYDPYNLIFLCRSCHQNKGGRDWKQQAKAIVKPKIVFNRNIVS